MKLRLFGLAEKFSDGPMVKFTGTNNTLGVAFGTSTVIVPE
jgi:hypothetical protein